MPGFTMTNALDKKSVSTIVTPANCNFLYRWASTIQRSLV